MEDRKILEECPLPAARGYRRFRNATAGRERHDAGYYLFEIYLKYAASIAVGHYLVAESRSHRVNAVLKGLARPSLGEWARFLRECLAYLEEQESPAPAVRAMAAAYREKDLPWEGVVRLVNALRAFRTGEESAREKVSCAMLLDEIVAYRNLVLGHGAPLGGGHDERFAGLFGAAFPELVRHSPFLTALRLVSFSIPRVRGGFRLECDISEFMGLQPVRRDAPLDLPYGATPPDEGVLHLLDAGGAFVRLDPLLIAHDEDVYFLNEAEGATAYLSYATGERFTPPGADDAARSLFERILGYRVDASRLSRIGDDLAPSEDAPADGEERRLGDYRIIREIGRGAMGTVFEAVQHSLGRRVALKTLPGTFALDPRRLERFHREARATARIHHPCIVPVYEVGEAGGTHYYAMEYIDGPSLDRVIRETREAPKRRPGKGSSTGDPEYIANVVGRMAELAEGVAEAHRLGLIHRDVKPSNILVDSSGRYVLIDFGLVREEEAATLTRSGEMVGTLTYMSPEQVSRRRVDARSDIYSLGVTLYELLTLSPPFQGESEHEVQHAILFKEPAPPRKLNPRLHRDLETIVLHAMEKDPDRRYGSASDLASDLRRFLRYEPIQAKPQSAWTRISRRIARHKGLAAAGAAIGALLIVLGIVFSLYRIVDRERREGLYAPKVEKAIGRMHLALSWMTRRGFAAAAPTSEGPLGFLEDTIGGASDPIEEAIADLREAIALRDDLPDAPYHLARALAHVGREEEALRALEEALRDNPGFMPALLLRAAISADPAHAAPATTEDPWAAAWRRANDAVAARDWGSAAEAYRILVGIEEARPGETYVGALSEFLFGSGVVLLEAGKYEGARQRFAQIRGRRPHASEAILLWGKSYCMEDRPEDAERLFVEVHGSAPPDGRDAIAQGAAALYFGLGWFEKGKDWAGKIEDVYARNCMLARFHYSAGEYGLAVGDARAAISADPARSSVPYVYLCWGLSVTGALGEAEEACREALKRFGEHPAIEVILAYDANARGDRERALVDLDGVIARHPKFYGAHLVKSWVHAGRGEWDKVNDAATASIACRDTYWGRWTRGLSRLRAQDVRGALQDLRAALERNPYGELVPGEIVGALMGPALDPTLAPEVDSHIALAERLLRSRVGDEGQLHRILAFAHARHPRGPDRERAIAAIESALKTPQAADPGLWMLLAESREAQDDLAEAVRILERAALRIPEGGALALMLERYRRRVVPILVSYASVDAALDDLDRRPLVGEEATWRFFNGAAGEPSDKPLAWTLAEFDDESWREGSGGFGLSSGGRQRNRRTVVAESGAAGAGFTTLYIRRNFSLDDRTAIESLRLRVWATGGFVAYLNGKEVGRARAPQGVVVPRDRAAVSSSTGMVPDLFELEPGSLSEGRNCLAIQWIEASGRAFSLEAGLDVRIAPDAGRDRELVKRVEPHAEGEDGQARLAYLRGRIEQRAGAHAAAIPHFERALAGAAPSVEPLVRLAECHGALGDHGKAESDLRRALERGGWSDKDLWDRWALISLRDLRLSAEEMLRRLPPERSEMAAYVARIRAFLTELRSGGAIRMNCGGPAYTGPAGDRWIQECFYTEGNVGSASGGEKDAISTEDTIRRTERFFPVIDPFCGYRIPIPPGTYSVTLWMGDFWFTEPGRRIFDIVVEDKVLRSEYNPPVEGIDKIGETFEIADGCLDITFRHRLENPNVCGIMIERVR